MAITNIFNLPTLAEILTQYQDTVQSENPETNPYIPRTDWYVKGQALSGIMSGAYADLSLRAQEIYPQYRTGNSVDLTLAYLGLPQRIPETFGRGNCYTDAVSFPFTVPAGTTLTNPNTGKVYTVYITTVVTSPSILIPFIANTVGIGNQENIGQQLNLSPTIGAVTYLIVNSSTDGSNLETDSQAVLRILNAYRIPPGGSRTTDYYNFTIEANALLSSPEITDALVIPAFLKLTNADGVLGVFGFGGSSPNDYLLNQSLINISPQLFYTRTLSGGAVEAMTTSIFNQKLISSNVLAATNETYILPVLAQPIIKVTATLIPNITLATILTIQSSDENNNPIEIQITVENLIKREVRRSIVNTPFGASTDPVTLLDHFIPISAIEQSLDYGLASVNISGIYASILADRKVEVFDGADYGYFSIPVPYELAPSYNIQATYDLAYNNITVTI